jgi:class 3 adenylate cyclase
MSKLSDNKEISETRKKTTEHIKNADRLLKSGDLLAALVEVEQALALDPSNYYALAYKKKITDARTVQDAATGAPAAPETRVRPEAFTPTPPPAFTPSFSTAAPPPEPAEPEPRLPMRKLAAIMFTDMVNYSSMSHMNEPLAMELLEDHRKMLRPIFAQFDGQEIKTIGDAFMVEFVSVLQAVRSAIEIQRVLLDYNNNADKERNIYLRIGIHIGDVVYQGEDIFGDGVNIAARLQEQADSGGICVSQDVFNQIRRWDEFYTEDKGEVALKNILTPVHIYKVYTSEETYRRMEEKSLESVREEGIKKAREETLTRAVAALRGRIEDQAWDESLRALVRLMAIDPGNQEAKTAAETIKSERKKQAAREIAGAENVPRQTFVDIYRRILQRAWSDGALSSLELSLLESVRDSYHITMKDHEELERPVQMEIYEEAMRAAYGSGEPSEEEEMFIAQLKTDLKIDDMEHAFIKSALGR